VVWNRTHALIVRVEFEADVDALDEKKIVAVSTGRRSSRFVLVALKRLVHSRSGLAKSRRFSMWTGSHLFVALSRVAGSLTLVLRSRLLYSAG
jgi:hypothetical protein